MLRGFSDFFYCRTIAQKLQFFDVLLFFKLICIITVLGSFEIIQFTINFIFLMKHHIDFTRAVTVKVRTWFEIKLGMNWPPFNYFCI